MVSGTAFIAGASKLAHDALHGIGSGANNTARYLDAALGIAIVVAIISGAGSSPDGLATGWNRAALLCGALNLAGAALATTLVARRRRATAAAPERSS